VSATPRECRIPLLSASSALGVAHGAASDRSLPSGFVRVVAMSGLSFGFIARNACVDVESVRILPVLLPKM
jgi:hypothetical protein